MITPMAHPFAPAPACPPGWKECDGRPDEHAPIIWDAFGQFECPLCAKRARDDSKLEALRAQLEEADADIADWRETCDEKEATLKEALTELKHVKRELNALKAGKKPRAKKKS